MSGEKKVPKIDFQMATEQSLSVNEENKLNNKMNIMENKTKESADNMSPKAEITNKTSGRIPY